MEFLKLIHMANCSENIGTVNCSYCESNKLYDANNQDGVGKRKKISTKKIIQNSSVADRVKIIQKDLTAISVTDIAVKINDFRNSFLNLLRSLIKNCKFVAFCTTQGKMCSTVKNLEINSIIYDLSKNIYSLLCGNQPTIYGIPTISIPRKYYNNYYNHLF